jgi:ethanolamine utilization protein EutN
LKGVLKLIIGRVIGNVISVIKDANYNDYKLLIVKEMNIDGGYESNYYISADLIGVGIDEVVLVVNGAASRSTKETNDKGFDSVITAKIEKLFFEDKEITFD